MTADSFGSRAVLQAGDESYEIYRLDAVDGAQTLPFSLKILLENLLRSEDGENITAGHVRALAGWDPAAEPGTEAVRGHSAPTSSSDADTKHHIS